jgi:hypothetical protein
MGPFFFTETILIPRAIIQQQLNLGVPGFILSREFKDSGSGVPNPVVSIRFTGSLGGAFSLSRLELQFDDSSKVRVVEQGTEIHAEAIVDFAGSGLLEAVWEVADPASTLGSAIFRQVRIIRVPLTGGRRTVVRSPPLPTVRAGLHIVRLRVTNSRFAAPDPQLSYSVVISLDPDAALPSIVPLSPLANAALLRDTLFAWPPVPGSVAYILEIHSIDDPRATPTDSNAIVADKAAITPVAGVVDLPTDSRAVAGMIVRAENTTTPLSGLSWSFLEAGQAYAWRVRAVDADGRIIAQSEPRRLVRP